MDSFKAQKRRDTSGGDASDKMTLVIAAGGRDESSKIGTGKAVEPNGGATEIELANGQKFHEDRIRTDFGQGVTVVVHSQDAAKASPSERHISAIEAAY